MGWTIKNLTEFQDGVATFYVDIKKPGTHQLEIISETGLAETVKIDTETYTRPIITTVNLH